MENCQKRLNQMRCLAGLRNGASRDQLFLFYHSYIKSLTNYALPVFSSRAPTNMLILGVIHSSAMRLIRGAWRSTPLPALCSSPPDHPIHKVFHHSSVVFQHKQYKAPLLYRNTRIVELSLQDTILTPNPPNSIISPRYPLSAVVYTTPLEHIVRQF